MDIFQSIVLGIVQGLTEFLPISSSGHLILVPKFFNWPDQGLAFDAVIHLAAVLAIIIVLRREIWWLLKPSLGNFSINGTNHGIPPPRPRGRDRLNIRIIGLIILAIIPAGLIGFFLNDFIASSLRTVEIVAMSLIFWAIILWLAEYYNNRLNKTDALDKLNWKHALVVGLMQIIALIPGTSRSGITITGGLFSKMDKSTAVKFSFLIGLPLILIAGIFKLVELIQTGIMCGQVLSLVIGFFSALISGLVAIKLLLWLANKASFKVFVIYRIILGLLLLLLML